MSEEAKTNVQKPEIDPSTLGVDPGLIRPTDRDPWIHRAERMRCRTCMWFVLKSGTIGRCRRHAPTMNGYPVVYITDWCGDHKLDEERT